MGTEILIVGDRLLAALMNGIYQGVLITLLVALGFRVFHRINAATRHAVWLCTLVLLVLLLLAHCFFQSRPPALQPGMIARTTPTPEQEMGAPNAAAMAAAPAAMDAEPGSSEPNGLGYFSAEREQPNAGGFLQTHPSPALRTPAPLEEERDGVRGTLQVPNFLHGDMMSPKPDSLSFSSTILPYEEQKLSVGSLPPPGAPLRAGEPDSSSIADATLASSSAADQSDWFFTAMRRLANPVSVTLGLESRASRMAGVILLGVCLTLSAAKLFMLLLRLHQIRKLKRQSFPASQALGELFQGLVARIGVARRVELRTLPASQSSFVLGFMHPVILLPAEPMEPAEAEPILRHELAHVRRRDDWANLLQHFLLAALPFHPAAWWISKRLSLEREIACDDYVLQSSAPPHAYALLLANLAARMQRCPPLLAPGASNNKTQLQQRIDMILNTRRNTSPRLAARWLAFMVSAAALFATAAAFLAPRIVLAQSGAAPAAANAQGSTIDEPGAPVVASVAVSVSPEAGVATSGGVALPATPEPAAIGPGPKFKTDYSIAVTTQPAVVPAPPTAALPALPAVPASSAAVAAPSLPPLPAGSIIVSAAPAPEPKPGRTPRPVRVESEDSTLEERLDRLEKMVESLMARGDANRNAYPMKPSADWVGPTDRKQIAEIEAHAKHQAEMALKHDLDVKQIERIKEQAKREAARAADQAKRHAENAERAARADQKRQNKRNLKDGSQRQLDDLRKQLENLEREREKVEHQIEELERQQEQQDEQREADPEVEEQSGPPKFNSDSIQAPRQ